nr:MAG TPA: hypothetical protein [Caudoviricetes sp.]
MGLFFAIPYNVKMRKGSKETSRPAISLCSIGGI